MSATRAAHRQVLHSCCTQLSQGMREEVEGQTSGLLISQNSNELIKCFLIFPLYRIVTSPRSPQVPQDFLPHPSSPPLLQPFAVGNVTAKLGNRFQSGGQASGGEELEGVQVESKSLWLSGAARWRAEPQLRREAGISSSSGGGKLPGSVLQSTPSPLAVVRRSYFQSLLWSQLARPIKIAPRADCSADC